MRADKQRAVHSACRGASHPPGEGGAGLSENNSTANFQSSFRAHLRRWLDPADHG